MKLSDIIKHLKSIFETKKKNLVQLENDSNLESKLKPLKVSDKNTPIHISEDTVDISGSLKVNGVDVVNQLNDLSDVTYSSGDLTINSLDKIILSQELEFRTTDGVLDVVAFKAGGQAAPILQIGAEGGTYSLLRLNENGGDSATDYFEIKTEENGETTITTVDAAGSNADLTVQIDGGVLIRGATTAGLHAQGTDATITSERDTNVDSGRYIGLDANSAVWYFRKAGAIMATIEESSFNLKEQADAQSDAAGFGQLWVHDTTPNELCFTDDAGTDIIGVGKYHYTVDVVNYSAAQLASFLPLGGYIIERTSTSSANEFISMVAPYNGFLVKAMFRSEIAQNGTIQFDIHESADNTEVPAASAVATKDTVVNIADDTTQEFDFSSMTTGNNVLLKGNIYAFKITTPSNSIDTNVTLVFKWDITS